MKKKMILLCGVLVLTCGCSATYEVDLRKEQASENVLILGESAEENDLLSAYNLYTPAYYDEQGSSEENIQVDGVHYYKMEHVGGLQFSYDFPMNQYFKSSALHYCYKQVDFKRSDGQLLLSTSKDFGCFSFHEDLTSVQVRVLVPEGYELVHTNSKDISSGVYSWTLAKDRADNSIFLSMQKSISLSSTEDVSSMDDEVSTKNSSIGIIVLILLGFGVVLLVLIRMNKRKVL